ncbi:hypothetical protein RUM43_009013 [Polyplax serrata]|uniref:CRAL-TRIO domain-containing protein n=1 Tax=Polyplax serrata TaxID=468196 RepID=A0AAN8S0W6_POLSC
MTKLKETSTDISFENNKEELLRAIEQLRDLMDEDRFLRVRNDDNFLLRYLRCSNYYPETALLKMQTYYRIKYQNPEWYITDDSISCFKEELNDQLYYVLEDKDRFGKCIYVNRLGMIDTSKTTMSRQSQLQDLFLECILDDENAQKHGLSVIVDLKNFSWTLLKWLTPSNVCIAVKKVESLPFKKIEFHVVNTSAVIKAAIKLVWPFLSYKTKENIHFHHDDWSSLQKTIPPECLPQQYGGTKLNLNVHELLRIIPGSKQGLKVPFPKGFMQGQKQHFESNANWFSVEVLPRVELGNLSRSRKHGNHQKRTRMKNRP